MWNRLFSYAINLVFSICTFSLTAQTLEFTQNIQGESFDCAHKNLTLAYQQLGYQLSFTTYPSKRALKLANAGKVDGEMLRIAGISNKYPNLIQVDSPICSVELVMIAHNSVQLHQDSDIANYHLGITLGYVHQERFAKQYNINVTHVTRNELLTDLLILNRVDVIFLTKPEAQRLIEKNKQFRILNRFSQTVYLYHYLHNKHKALHPIISQKLLELSEQGKLDLSINSLNRNSKFGS